MARHARSRCMNCSAKPTHDVKWANGRARAWFCDRHYAAFVKKNPGEVSAHHSITTGIVPETFSGRK